MTTNSASAKGCRLASAIWAFGLLLLPGTLLAQDPQTLTLRMLPTSDDALQTRLFASLAKYAESIQLGVIPGRSVDEVVRQRCGFISGPLRAVIQRANPGLDFQAQPQPRTVELPPCPYWRFDGTVDVSKIDNLSSMLMIRTGYAGGGTIRQVALRNPTIVDSAGKLLSNRGMLVLPYQAKAFTLILRPGAGTPESVALALARSFPTLLRDSFVRNYVRQGGAVNFSVNKVFVAATDGAHGCSGRTVNWPFDSNRIAEALIANEKFADSSTRFPKGVVLIADTGLREIEAPRYPMWTNPGETGPHARWGRDDDGNDYDDDIHGANMNREPGFPAAVENFIDADHGTQVASMMIAPWIGARMRTLFRDRVSIALANVVETQVFIDREGAPNYQTSIPPGTVERAFGYVTWMRPASAVLNISLKSDAPYPMIGTILSNAQFLTVMAAGNDGQQIDLTNKEVYPVGYRRDAKGLVLTVAAHDGEGKIAKFSNYGRGLVDLAAPGCALETFSFDGKRVVSSGTSLSAPLVSMTAALLYAAGITSPREIRNRILTTTDFDASLKSALYSSGRLNMEKALRIYQDIVVPLRADGNPDEPKFGEISLKNSFSLCNDIMSLRDILKIIPRYQGGIAPMLVVRRIGNEKGAQNFCPPADDFEIEFNEEGAAVSRKLKLKELHELIPAAR